MTLSRFGLNRSLRMSKDTLEIIKESRKAGVQAAWIVFATLVVVLIGVSFVICAIANKKEVVNIDAKTSMGSNYIQSK